MARLLGVRWFRRRMSLDFSGCTLFERKVYAALRRVPSGMTVTYGELARRAGYPRAARAVGSALKRNRLPVAIPCHRVIPASGGIGEYSGGKQWKRMLLEHESSSRDAKRSPLGVKGKSLGAVC